MSTSLEKKSLTTLTANILYEDFRIKKSTYNNARKSNVMHAKIFGVNAKKYLDKKSDDLEDHSTLGECALIRSLRERRAPLQGAKTKNHKDNRRI